MAEGFARHLGVGVINAASAGLSSTHAIAPETVSVMLEKGIDIRDQFPKDYEPGLAGNYDIIVNISGFELPLARGPVLTEWIVRDPYGNGEDVHRRVRDEIERLVRQLIADVERNGALTQHRPHGQRIAPNESRRARLWERITRRRS
jgi:arsenate reductase (thioredoxin)